VTRLAFVGAHVLAPDASSFSERTVHVDSGIITGVDSLPPSPAELTVDVTGRYLIPGLIDAHYHLISRSEEVLDARMIAGSMIEGVINAEDCIASGVTSVRDCGCRHEGIYTLQEAIAAGAAVGPDSMTAGRNPTGENAPRHWRNVFASGPDAMRAAVRSQVEAGAGWVKVILAHAFDPLDWADVTEFMSDDEITAAVDEAHLLGVRIGAHCEGWEVAERAIRLGLDSLDHAPLLSDAAVAEMKARGMTYTPTVWAFSSDAGVDLEALPPSDAARIKDWRAQHRASVRRAFDAGVPIAAGSDSASAVTGRGVLVDEMEALLECGLPSPAVLAAATLHSAAVMGRGDIVGAISATLRADLVVLTEDPLVDLAALRNPESVWKAGVLRSANGSIVQDTVRALDDAVVARWDSV
jgi:imidazolonepropionase-like amidohydrolase